MTRARSSAVILSGALSLSVGIVPLWVAGIGLTLFRRRRIRRRRILWRVLRRKLLKNANHLARVRVHSHIDSQMEEIPAQNCANGENSKVGKNGIDDVGEARDFITTAIVEFVEVLA